MEDDFPFDYQHVRHEMLSEVSEFGTFNTDTAHEILATLSMGSLVGDSIIGNLGGLCVSPILVDESVEVRYFSPKLKKEVVLGFISPQEEPSITEFVDNLIFLDKEAREVEKQLA